MGFGVSLVRVGRVVSSFLWEMVQVSSDGTSTEEEVKGVELGRTGKAVFVP